jgi:hypothetical protein
VGMKFLKWIAFAATAALSAPLPAQEAPLNYANANNWLCLPGQADPCSRVIDTVALNPNGYGSVGRIEPAELPLPAVDCFYVYPTVSRDAALNSDLEMGPEEQIAAYVQFARFSSVCRTFAPKYRQATLAALGAAFAGADVSKVNELAYADVRAAWNDYLQNRNGGRPYVLIGHSQGSIHLSRLLAEEIEGKPEARRMLSAMLPGWVIEVPEGEAVGGTFKQTPLCTKPGQTGCVISYMTFRATNPPPEGSLFGRAMRPGMTAACTNPAALAGGGAKLDSYWFTAAPPQPGAEPVAWSSQGAPATPFVRTEGLASAACVHRGRVGYLSILTDADPADARTDHIPGDVYIAGRIVPSWGMHLADLSLVQGDLIALVERQAKAFAR